MSAYVASMRALMETHDRNALAAEAKAMTRREVIQKAIEGTITWFQAAHICGVTPRHMSRLRLRFEQLGIEGLKDARNGKTQPRRIESSVEDEVVRLKRELYPDFNTQHFHDTLRRMHAFKYGYTWTLAILQKHGLVTKAPGRGQYRRKRERRAMRGMMLHLDASRHTWIEGQPQWDLNVVLDDADGKILYAEFLPEEGVHSTLKAIQWVLQRHGRFAEFYTDRGSHFCTTSKAGAGPNEVQNGTVARVLRTLGIHHILARSPEARGRSERAFGTIQGRLPQELRVAGVTTYDEANRYLQQNFIDTFNEKFSVTPRDPEVAFTSVRDLDLELLLSIQHERRVKADNTVSFQAVELQLQPGASRPHFVRCPVIVHELLNGTLAVSFLNKLIGRFSRDGVPLTTTQKAA